MLLRSTEGSIYRSDSTDGGVSWCPPYDTGLPNNNSGIDLDRLPNGWLVLACNPVADNWGARTPMSLLVSRDNGVSWDKLLDLDSGKGEFAYPAVVASGPQLHVCLLYTSPFSICSPPPPTASPFFWRSSPSPWPEGAGGTGWQAVCSWPAPWAPIRPM